MKTDGGLDWQGQLRSKIQDKTKKSVAGVELLRLQTAPPEGERETAEHK